MISFMAKIDIYDFKKYVYTCVYFPKDVLAKLPLDQYPRLRVNAIVDGRPCDGALMPDKAGSRQTEHLLNAGYKKNERVWYLQVPKNILRQINKQVGDTVTVAFEIADQDAVVLPAAIKKMLAEDEMLRSIWDRLTPSKRRSLVHPVLNAKTDSTREKRLLAFIDQLAEL
jgi:hypothetical protein